jgi:protein-S-isoprenylcysteine O-methyltransferase Ste14
MMTPNFLIAFAVCLFAYIYHTATHFLEYKGHTSKSRISEIIITIIVFVGYIGWGFMIFLDPIKIPLSDYIAKPLGLLIGLIGLVMFVLSAKAKKGFYELDHLVTKGIYSKIRNPMYLGIILLHIGFPLAAKSLLTLLSALIWIPLILMWKYWEEKDLEENFGKEYAEYKSRTLF